MLSTEKTFPTPVLTFPEQRKLIFAKRVDVFILCQYLEMSPLEDTALEAQLHSPDQLKIRNSVKQHPSAPFLPLSDF